MRRKRRKKWIKEEECRKIFEMIFGVPFKKCRPKWLRNSRNNLMELDGYSKLLKIAFEYQGIQHYQQVDKIFGHKIDLSWQQQRDREKAELCRKYGIALIVIPWYVKSLRRFIRSEIRKMGLVGDIPI